MKKLLEKIKSKWLIKGTTTIILVAIVVACYVGINLLAENIKIEDIDFTEKKLYSLSDETKSKLKDLDEEITIQLINMEQNYYIQEYAQKYEALTDKIKVERIDDLSKRIDIKTQYNLEDAESLILVKTDKNEKKIKESDLYTYEYTSSKPIDRTEEAITNAIVELTINKTPVIYILSTNTYYETQQMLQSVIEQLETDSNQVQSLDILTKGEVPLNCDCLLITTLKKDITELERDKIIEYIRRGGKIMLLTSQNIVSDVEMPNYEAVLAEYGFSIKKGAIFEQDKNKMLQNAPEFAIVNANASFMNDIDMALQMCVIDAGKIEFEDEEKLKELGVEYEIIASTGGTSFIRTDFDQKSYTKTEKDGEEGVFTVGARLIKTISEDVKSELIVFSSEVAASNMQIPIGNQYYMYAVDLHNNRDIILNSISYLTERKDTITIRKTDEAENYTVTEQQDTIIKIVIFTLPVIIIIIGIVIWVIRKRRK